LQKDLVIVIIIITVVIIGILVMPNNFSLGGTPLNDTIVVAKSVIEEFRMKSRAQIVNAVFLTDGQSNQSNEFLNSANEVERFNRYSVHIDDPVTRMRVFPEDVKKV
jgi:hypothetical protein